jgi:DsbE subfamily thiol:disulfide oxidoreductase
VNRKSLLITLSGLLLGILLGLAILWSSGVFRGTGGTQASKVPLVGQVMPDFSLMRIDGSTGKLSDFKGHPVLVNFWATWCAPCKEEMPLLQSYYQKYSPDLVVLGVNYEDGKFVAQQYLQENGIKFPVYLDSDGTTVVNYAVRGFPTTFFIDKDGVLRSEHIGQLNEELLSQYLGTIGLKQ